MGCQMIKSILFIVLFSLISFNVFASADKDRPVNLTIENPMVGHSFFKLEGTADKSYDFIEKKITRKDALAFNYNSPNVQEGQNLIVLNLPVRCMDFIVATKTKDTKVKITARKADIHTSGNAVIVRLKDVNTNSYATTCKVVR